MLLSQLSRKRTFWSAWVLVVCYVKLISYIMQNTAIRGYFFWRSVGVVWWRFTISRGCIIDDPLKSTRCYRQVLAVLLYVNAVSSLCWDSFWGRTERSIIRNHSRLVQHTVGDSTAGWKVQLTEIQLFEVCVVVGYASYSYCNEISQVQLYLKMLRLKHSGVLQRQKLRRLAAELWAMSYILAEFRSQARLPSMRAPSKTVFFFVFIDF